ncbi:MULTISPECIES: peptidylprolyl isomerase [unclassified Oleiphilus]|uniref:FKBP-type peptidyl-prolyl cis-trans isomerase n=2 Tax=Oleiphilus TaxID=141450 RepID=UPI0007C27397|nr:MULTISPECIES: peptidylprolyl isomerase [unclassified Oleiphilus]KZY45034.1 peptidylprolyl isomerase [Oleiphilus sp. HI0050]KZZ33619.1 peptidylprolyl isomerase [Oleiphilus sp. HI0086]KZZ38136.1 peptidylprolyl isomerase [Oleiphilus sp. HI0117]
MQISKDKVVTFHYRLSNEQGSELEASHGEDPVAYLHGHGNIISGLEKGLEGQSAEDVLTVTVEPQDGYGLRKEEAVQRVPIKHLVGDKKQNSKLKPGMVVSINTEEGPRQVVVLKAGKFNVDVDTNHPLAGQVLSFDIEIQSVREATEDELAHGHAHGVGGHHH